jgi:hypothetical protein
MWTGEFLHGLLEDAYQHWLTFAPAFPWPYPATVEEVPSLDISPPDDWPANHVGRLGLRTELRLKAAGRTPRNRNARFNAYRRAAEAINVLGPDMFPLITTAEERISGTREISLPQHSPRNSDRYELTGIVDVISSVQLRTHASNALVQQLLEAVVPDLDDFDVIVDYKGMRRPSRSKAEGGSCEGDLWTDHAWQVQTYAHLRSARSDRAYVACGLIVYLNELFPSRQDLSQLREDLRRRTSDVLPADGSSDYYALLGVDDASEDLELPETLPALSLDFRIRRALRIIPVDKATREAAANRIHDIVAQIEALVADEHVDGDIHKAWSPTGKRRDCVACDFKHSCPKPDLEKKKPYPVAPG